MIFDMIYKFDSFWSYVGNESWETIEAIKVALTISEYDFKASKYNVSKFYLVHNCVLGKETIKFPSGLCEYLSKRFGLEIDYKRNAYERYTKEDVIKIAEKAKQHFSNFEIRDYQIEGVLASTDKFQSLIHYGVATGKTSVMSLLVMLWENKRILITCNQNFILQQIYDRLVSLGVCIADISMSGEDLGRRIQIMSSQLSYNKIKRKDVEYLDYLKGVQCIIEDECQHSQSASSFMPLFFTPSLEHHVGYSGSAYRKPDNPYGNSVDLMTIGLFGEPAAEYSMNDSIGEKKIAQPYLYSINYKGYPISSSTTTDFFIQYRRGIVYNKARNRSGIELIKYLNKNNIKTLVLFREVKRHGLPVMKMLKEDGVDALFLQGGEQIHEYDSDLKLHTRAGTTEDIKEELRNGRNIIFASQVMDEGVDIDLFQAGVLFTGGKSAIKITQQAGRISRAKKDGENIALIVDFNDTNLNPLFCRQYQERRKTLLSHGVVELANVYKMFELVEKMKS